MKKEEIEKAISEFKKVYVHEAQLLTFKKKLIYKIRDNELKYFAISELIKIKSNVKEEVIKSNLNNKQNIKHKKKEKKSKINEKSKTENTNKKDNQFDNRILNDSQDTIFNYSSITYKELAEQIGVQISFIERLIYKFKIDQTLDINKYIEKDNWIIIKDFVLNKIKIINTTKRKEELDKSIHVKRNKVSTTPLRQYVGGNFGKLIFTGKTS